MRPEIWDEFTDALRHRAGVRVLCRQRGQHRVHQHLQRAQDRTGIAPMPVAYVEYDADTGAPLRDDDGRVRRVPAGEPGLLLSPVNRLQPFDGYTDKERQRKEVGAQRFPRGRLLVQHRRRDEPAGHGARRVRRPARRHLPLEGRERRHHPGRAGAGRRPCRRGVHRLRRRDARAPAAGPEWRRSSCATAPSSTARRWRETVYEQLPAYALPLFVRVVGVDGAHHRRSRAARSTCASRPTGRHRRIRCTCWPAATRATCRSTTATPMRWRTASVHRAERFATSRRAGERATVRAVVAAHRSRRRAAPARPISHESRAVDVPVRPPVAGDRALIMAIVNRTPDSFYDRGATFTDEAAKAAAHRVIAEGADVIDVGGVKAGPGQQVDADDRDRPGGAVHRVAARRIPRPTDQRRHLAGEVAKLACAAGADLINDTWGGADPGAARGGGGVRRRTGVLAYRGRAAPHPAVPGELRDHHPRGGRRRHRRSHRRGRTRRRRRGGPRPRSDRPDARFRQEHLSRP